MERLTIRNSDGSVSQPMDLRWADALNRLAAYEDTGLEPREISAAMKDGTYAQFQEWNRAHYEGRLLVLPTVKTNADKIRQMSDEELAKWIAGYVLGLKGGMFETSVNSWLDWLKQEVEE